MTRRYRNVLGLTIASLSCALAPHAHAADIDIEDDSSACHISGSMSVHDDETAWSVLITDLRGEGYDCFARIVIERGERADSEIRSFKTNGQDDVVTFDGKRTRAQTTGATLYACVDRGDRGDDCTEIHHIDEL